MTLRGCVSLLVLLGAACTSATTVPDSRAGLYGRWRNIGMTVYMADGAVIRQQVPGVDCVQELSESRSVTNCTLPNGRTTRSVAKIVAWTPQGYELETVEHTNPLLVGLRTRVEYRIEGNKRYSTLYPPRFQDPSLRSYSVKMETVDIRE